MNVDSPKDDFYINDEEFTSIMDNLQPDPSVSQEDIEMFGGKLWMLDELIIPDEATIHDGISSSLDLTIAVNKGRSVINSNKRRGEERLDNDEFNMVVKRLKYREGAVESTELANDDGTIIRCLLLSYTRLPSDSKRELLDKAIQETLRHFDTSFVPNRPIYIKLLVEMMYAAKIAKLDFAMEVAKSYLKDLELKEDDKYQLMGMPKDLWGLEYQMDENLNPNLWAQTWDKSRPRHCRMMNNYIFLYNLDCQLKYGWMMLELETTTKEESEDFLAIVENTMQYLSEYEEDQTLSKQCFVNIARLVETIVTFLTSGFTVQPPDLPHLLSICKSLHKKIPKSQTVGLDLLRACSSLEEAIRAFDHSFNETKTSTRHFCFATIECIGLNGLAEITLAIDRSICKGNKLRARDEQDRSLFVDVACGQFQSPPEKQPSPEKENILLL